MKGLKEINRERKERHGKVTMWKMISWKRKKEERNLRKERNNIKQGMRNRKKKQEEIGRLSYCSCGVSTL